MTDKTKSMYWIKLWGPTAVNFKFEEPIVVAIRRGRLDEYEGQKIITVTANTLFMVIIKYMIYNNNKLYNCMYYCDRMFNFRFTLTDQPRVARGRKYDYVVRRCS